MEAYQPGGRFAVDTRDVREGRLVGLLALPKGVERPPGVVVLPGSGGGIPGPLAIELASEGFAALALAYFGIEPLPAELVEVPFEVLEGGIGYPQQGRSSAIRHAPSSFTNRAWFF